MQNIECSFKINGLEKRIEAKEIHTGVGKYGFVVKNYEVVDGQSDENQRESLCKSVDDLFAIVEQAKKDTFNIIRGAKPVAVEGA